MPSRLRILLIASEVAPFAKTGGLADVAGALPRALAALGHDVRILLPKYRGAEGQAGETRLVVPNIRVPLGDRDAEGALIEGRAPSGVPVYLLEHEHYYNRDSLYGTSDGDYWDNCERFVFFCRAALEGMARLDAARPGIRWQPQVVHANDWQTGLLPVYLRTLYRDHPMLGSLASVFTIHNLAYQGVFWHYDMPMTGLGWDLFTPAGLEFYGKLNFVKGGLIFSDLLTTVSRTYAREIRTPAFGSGLEGVLEERSRDLHGVINGIDYEMWDPQKDPAIAHPYSAADPEPKAVCRETLRRELGLEDGAGPTRLCPPCSTRAVSSCSSARAKRIWRRPGWRRPRNIPARGGCGWATTPRWPPASTAAPTASSCPRATSRAAWASSSRSATAARPSCGGPAGSPTPWSSSTRPDGAAPASCSTRSRQRPCSRRCAGPPRRTGSPPCGRR